jgi:hypothetical protein
MNRWVPLVGRPRNNGMFEKAGTEWEQLETQGLSTPLRSGRDDIYLAIDDTYLAISESTHSESKETTLEVGIFWQSACRSNALSNPFSVA